MTEIAKELMEDVQVGDYVQVRYGTDSDQDSYEGEVLKWSDNFLSLRENDGEITRIRLDDNLRALKIVKGGTSKKVVPESVREEATNIAENKTKDMRHFSRQLVQLEQSQPFSITVTECIQKTKDRIKKSDTAIVRRMLEGIVDSLSFAIKNKEVRQKYHNLRAKVINVHDECCGRNDYEAYCYLLGSLSFIAEDYAYSIEPLVRVNEYMFAAYSASLGQMLDTSNVLTLCALLSGESLEINKHISDICVARMDIETLKELLQVYKDDVAMCEKIASCAMNLFSASGGSLTVDVTPYFSAYNAAKQLLSDIPTDLQQLRSSVSWFKEFSAYSFPEYKEETTDAELTGHIYNYDSDKKFGFISPNNYFYITQVYSGSERGLMLRKMLSLGMWNGLEVVFRLGKSQTQGGSTAATAIELTAKGFDDAVSRIEKATQAGVTQTGFIEVYYDYYMTGRIQSSGKKYNFKTASIIDPWLKAYFENGFSFSEQDVTFEVNGKNAVNICWLNPKEDDRVAFENMIKPEDMKRWEEYLSRKDKREKIELPETDPYAIFLYTDLDALDGKVTGDSFSLSWNGTSIIEKAIKGKPMVKFEPERTTVSDNRLGKDVTSGKHYADLARNASQNGKLDDAGHMFEKALEVGGFSEPIVCDYILLCIRQDGKSDKAVQLLKKYEKQLSAEKLLTVSIQVYDKIKDYDTLIPLYEKTFRTSPTLMRKNHYLVRLVDAHIKLSNYSKALLVCQQWEQFYTQNRFSSDADKIKKAESNIKRQKAICLYHLGETDQAKSIATELVRINPADVAANSILEGTLGKKDVIETDQPNNEGNLDGEMDNPDDEPTDESQMSRFVRMSVQQMDIVSVLKTANVKDGHYVGTSKEGLADIEKLVTGRKISAKTRSDSLFAACKLFEQIEQREDGIIQNVNRKYRYAGRAMASWGDFMVSQSSQLDTPRMAYLYALKVLTPTTRGAEQDWINSYNRFIKSFFLARIGSNSLEEYINLQNSSPNRDGINTDILLNNRIPTVLAPEFVASILMMIKAISNQRDRVSTFISELYNKSAELRNIVFEQLKNLPGAVEEDVCTYNTFSRSINNGLVILQKQHYNLRNSLIEASAVILSQPLSKGILIELGDEKWKNYLTATDFTRLSTMCHKILKRSLDFFNTGDFENRSDCLRAILVEAKELMHLIKREPTDISYDVLLPALEQIILRVNEKQNDLYQVFLPKLSWTETIQPFKTPDGQIQIQMTLENEINYQSADSISITNVYGPDILWFDAPPTIQSLRGGDEVEMGILIAVSDIAKSTGSFTATVSWSYKCSDAPQNVITKNMETEFTFIIRNDNFVPLVNPYSAYEGKPMDDDSMFVGRSTQIQQIMDMICQNDTGSMNYGRAIAMYGQTRTGKSSLMYHLKKKLIERYQEKVLIWDIGNIGELQESSEYMANFLYNLLYIGSEAIYEDDYLADIVDEIGLTPPLQEIRNDPSFAVTLFNEYMKKLNPILKRENRIIVLLIDEFTYLHGYINEGKIPSSFMRFWKAFLQNYCVFAIVAGQDDMPEFIREYQNEFACMELLKLNYLDERDAKQLVQVPLEQVNNRTGLFKNDGSIHKIYSLTAGSAYLTIILCSKLVSYLNEKGAYVITKGIVNEFLRTRAFGPRGFLTEVNFEAQLQERGHRELDDINRDILISIARLSQTTGYARASDIECQNLSLSDIQAYVDRLVDRNVLIKEGRDQYWIQVKLLERWLINTMGV